MKSNFILISGFATNSFELKHLISFLNRFVSLHFIDLPGFSKQVPPLKKISLDNYVAYVNDQIKKLNLDEYWLGGLSFGFLLANHVRKSKKCKGIFAIEPYLNINEVKESFLNKITDLIVIKFIHTFKLYKWFWYSPYFKKLLTKNNLAGRVTRMLRTMDARSFFEVAWILLTNKEPIKFKKKPPILLINENDELVCANEEEAYFKKKIKELLIVHTSASHVPKRMPSEKYFEKHVGLNNMKKIIKFTKQF